MVRFSEGVDMCVVSVMSWNEGENNREMGEWESKRTCVVLTNIHK